MTNEAAAQAAKEAVGRIAPILQEARDEGIAFTAQLLTRSMGSSFEHDPIIRLVTVKDQQAVTLEELFGARMREALGYGVMLDIIPFSELYD